MKKIKPKRLLGLLLILAIVVGMLPMTSLPVYGAQATDILIWDSEAGAFKNYTLGTDTLPTGLSWNSTENRLELDGYNGGPIKQKTSADELTFYVVNDSTITGIDNDIADVALWYGNPIIDGVSGKTLNLNTTKSTALSIPGNCTIQNITVKVQVTNTSHDVFTGGTNGNVNVKQDGRLEVTVKKEVNSANYTNGVGNLFLHENGSASITVIGKETAESYGAAALYLYGTGTCTISVTNSDGGSKAVQYQPTVNTAYNVTGAWDSPNVTYTALPDNENANLSHLYLPSGGTISPAFNFNATAYTVAPDYQYTQDTAKINATVQVTGASLKINGEAATSGVGKDVSLAVGENVIPIEVTAKDGVTTKTYNITIIRLSSGEYALNVANGTSTPNTATVEAGTIVTITANAPAEGKVFDRWTSSDVTLADSNSATTTFTMPTKDVTVTATYRDVYSITVNDGSADKTTASQGETVTITADTPASGKVFDKWTSDDGVTFADASKATTTFYMPGKSVTVTANYKSEDVVTELYTIWAYISTPSTTWEQPALDPVYNKATRTYDLNVGTDYNTIYFYLSKMNNEQAITATVDGNPLEGTLGTNTFSTNQYSLTQAKTVFVFTVTAKDGTTTGTYTVTVNRGSGTTHSVTVNGGSTTTPTPAEGDTVTITANDAASGKVFDKWTSDDVTFANENDATTTFVMPNKAVTVTANYKNDPDKDTELKDIKVKIYKDSWVDLPLTPTYDKATSNYVLNVNMDYTNIYFYLQEMVIGQAVTATVDGATLAVTTATNGFNTANHTFTQAKTVFVFTVTAKDGTTTGTYTVTVNRGSGTTYPVTVNGGTTTPTPAEGDTVTITANDAASGKVFDKWTSDDVTLANENDATTTFVMPNKAVTVTANYKNDPNMDTELDIIGVNIWKELLGWQGGTLTPAYDKATRTYDLNVGTEYSTIYFYLGEMVSGQGVTATVDGTTLAVTTAANGFNTAQHTFTKAQTVFIFTVTAKDTTTKGTYTVTVNRGSGITYSVTVNGGTTTTPTPAEGDTVTITANDAAEGKVFDKWTSDDVTFANKNDATTTFVMPNKAVTVRANYKNDSEKDTELNNIVVEISTPSTTWEQPALDPVYDKATRTYDLNVGTEYNTIYFVLYHMVDGQAVTATVDGNPLGVTSDWYGFSTDQHSLTKAQTIFVFTVTSKDGTKTGDYTITVNRGTTYTITYDSNGGTGTMVNGTASAGVAFTLPDNGFTSPAGKQFKAWDINGVEYPAGDSYTFTDNTSVKAVWEDITYSITVINGTTDKAMALPEQTVTVTAKPPVPGQVFDRWTSDDIPTFNYLANPMSFTMPSNPVTLTATYKTDPNIVTELKDIKAYISIPTFPVEQPPLNPIFDKGIREYTLNIGTTYTSVNFFLDPMVDGQAVTATVDGTPLTVIKSDGFVTDWHTFTKDATVFVFTVTSKDSSTTETYKVTINRGTTYTIIYDSDGGTGTMLNGTASAGVAFTLPANGFTPPAGKQFKAWDINGVEYAPGTTYTFTANTSVKAVWEDVLVTSIAVKSTSHKTAYKVGDTLDVTNLTIEATMSDSTKQTINVISNMVAGFDSSGVTASQTLSISYGGKTTSYNISIDKADGPSAPTGLVAVKPTTLGGSDGKITGTSTLMEYASDSSFTSPTACTATETTGLSAGTYYVRVKETATHKAGAYATVTVPVGTDATVAVTSVALNKSTLDLLVDSEEVLIATVLPTEATNKNIIWSSSDNTIATVDTMGRVTALAVGMVTISATTEDGSYIAGCVVNVTKAVTYAVTISDGGVGASGSGSYIAGTNVNIYAGNRSGYTFTGWKSLDVEITNTSSKNASFTMPEKPVKVTASWSYNGGDSTVIIEPTIQPTIPAVNGLVKVEYSISSEVALLSISNAKANEIIAKAEDKEAVLDLKALENITSVKIPYNALNSFLIADLDLLVELPEGRAALDNKALESVLAQSSEGADIKLELKQLSKDNLLEAQKKSVRKGDLVFDINILMGTKKITEFDGELKINIPYDKELPVAVWYVDNKGNLNKIESLFIDGQVSFVLKHLSVYLIGEDKKEEDGGTKEEPKAKDEDKTKDEIKKEDKWINPFTDVDKSKWFYEDVKYVYKNNLMKGKGGDTFRPYGTTTRGMVVTILHRLEGLPLAIDNRFNDVKADKYYAKAVSWASENNIVSGYGANKFGPDKPITREQLAKILMNYAKYKGYDVSAKSDLANYQDVKDISNWAVDAMSWANAENLIRGDGTNLMPTSNLTRAQVAAVISRFIKRITP